MLCLPYTSATMCPHTWHYHWHSDHANDPVSTLMAGDCATQKVQAILTILSSEDLTQTLLQGHNTDQNWIVQDEFQRLNYYCPRYWSPVVAAAVQGVAVQLGIEGMLSFDDLYCHTCHAYVNKALEPEHWHSLCGTCSHHKDECECCENCHYSPCECCQICGEKPAWDCNCCTYCGNTSDYCECRLCDSCGYKSEECGCYGGGSYGSTTVAPWQSREDLEEPMNLPKMADCQHNEIDPVQSVADFYLLDAIKNLVRASDIEFGTEDQERRFSSDRAAIVRSDSMLSALVTSAERSYRAMVDYLAPNFLAYALPAVGGELRYHRCAGKAMKANGREQAWDKFVDVVAKKGPETLFEADTLFLEFGGGAYGGKPWGDAAKVVGQYLNGTMPSWLFVDRVFTLQHNGGCFLNKVKWRKRNRLHWGLSKIQYVLNAHASKDYQGQDGPMDWRLLLDVASPEVASLFNMTERHLARIARRFGGVLVPIGHKSTIRTSLEIFGY